MPLTKTGKKVLRKFKSEYGDKAGKSYYYAKMNRDPSWASKMHEKRPRKKLVVRRRK